MKISELSEAFDTFDGLTVTINTKIEVVHKGQSGMLSFRGYIIDKDDHMVYIGENIDYVSAAIKWEEICTIEVFNGNDEFDEILPGSGIRN